MSSRGPRPLLGGLATPIKLSFRNGSWSLVVEVLEQATAVVFKPARYTIEGPEQIIDALRGIGATPKLVDATARCFNDHAREGAEALELEPSQDRWVPISSLPTRHDRQQGAQARDLTARKRALRRILDRLSAAQRATERGAILQRRVAELESRVRTSRPSRPLGAAPPPSTVEGARVRVTSYADAPLPADFESAEGAGLRALPTVSEIRRELALVLGLSVELTEVKTAAPTPMSYVAWIVGNDEEILGAILSDLRGAVMLGSALLMDSAASIEAQIAAGEPAQEVVHALSEVFDSVADAVAAIEGNPAVHVQPTAALGFGAPTWLDAPSLRLEMDVSGGRLLIVAR